MNMKFNRKMHAFSRRQSSGMTILDVLLGIVIFVVGMLALASLQGNLTRSTSEGNARTVGTNLAEELIEQLRVFDSLRASTACPTALDAIVTANAYQCITDATAPFPRNGFTYTAAIDVTDYYFMPDGVTLTDDTNDLPSGRDTTISDFKHMELTVSWDANNFLDNEGNTIAAGDLGAGSFSVASIIPSIPQLGAAEIAAEDDGEFGSPPIEYTPGERPDIVAVNLNNNKFKESTTPIPDVKRADELVETWFDVITYNTLTNSVYLRREEFLAITCKCELRAKPGDGTKTGFLPTIWNGEEYVSGNPEGEMVSKAYGVSASNQQSQYCDTCCRDHHDDEDNYPADHHLYDPKREWSESGASGDHVHYSRSNQGVMAVAQAGDDYVEACRMVRKDGFMRVAQDFRQEGLISFPAGFLDTAAGVESYSDYVTDAVYDFYNKNRDELTPPSGNPVMGPPPSPAWSYDFPADKISTAGELAPEDVTRLPMTNGLDAQQMRARGIYIDELSPDVQTMFNCEQNNGTDCLPEGVENILQVLPFYELQTTWLAWWMSNPAGTPVSLTNEEVKDDNAHSRGLAVLEDPAANDQIDIMTEMYRGNVGLTVTDPITLSEKNGLTAQSDHYMYMDVGTGDDGTVDTSRYQWSGTFVSGVNGVDASNATLTEGGNAFCSRSGIDISCATPQGESGSLTISGYTSSPDGTYLDLWICVTGGAGLSVTNVPEGANNSATITWAPGTAPTNVVISIEDSACAL